MYVGLVVRAVIPFYLTGTIADDFGWYLFLYSAYLVKNKPFGLTHLPSPLRKREEQNPNVWWFLFVWFLCLPPSPRKQITALTFLWKFIWRSRQ